MVEKILDWLFLQILLIKIHKLGLLLYQSRAKCIKIPISNNNLEYPLQKSNQVFIKLKTTPILKKNFTLSQKKREGCHKRHNK